jgi:putative transposase
MVMTRRQADNPPLSDVALKHRIGEQTMDVWRRRFGAMATDAVKRSRTLDEENARPM